LPTRADDSLLKWQTEALFGYSEGEMIGKPVEMLLPERFRKHHPSLRASYARNPRLRSMGEQVELYAQHRNGSEFPSKSA